MSQIQFFGNNYLEYSLDRLNDNRYFENWTEINLRYRNWHIGLRYEIHLPPQVFSQDTVGQGIYQKFLEYWTGNLNITIGNFYTILGRGLVLRSFENRNLRWDTNIDGLRFEYRHSVIDLKLLGGRARDRSGRRQQVFQAAEMRLKPFRPFHVGGTFLTTRLPSRGDVAWGSVFAEISLGSQTVFVEYAIKDYPREFPEGRAMYLSGNFFLGPLSLLAEFKDYDQFDLTEGVTYNNPPSVVREHLYTLLNRHQKVEEPNDEKGFLLEASYPVLENGILTFNYNITRNHRSLRLYEEYYAQLELDYPSQWEWVWAHGQQKDLEARYLNFLNSTSFQFSDFNSLKFIFEHQHVRILLSDRQFYNQAFMFSFSHAPNFTISLLGEYSTDQISDKNVWGGLQLDLHFLEKFDLTVFTGTRREGKICAGGVCVVRPEFEGVEFILVNRF